MDTKSIIIITITMLMLMVLIALQTKAQVQDMQNVNCVYLVDIEENYQVVCN